MKTLFFGNSHVGAYKRGFNLLSEMRKETILFNELYEYYHQIEPNFISIPGPNWMKVTINDSPVIGIPDKTYVHINGIQTSKVNNSYEFTSFNTLDYDYIIFCRGANIVTLCRLFNSEMYPSLLTSSILDYILTHRINPEFKRIMSSNSQSRFIYDGSPVRFLESRIDWDNSNFWQEQIHSRNISYLRQHIHNRMGFDVLIPPPHCIDSSGRFTFDKYGKDPKRDIGHANANYAIEMLIQLKEIIGSI